MPLPTSGPLSLNDIKGEFGGPTSPSLGDYYAGGANVPAGTSGTNGAVPSSGTISISNFYGTSKAVFRLDAAGYSDFGAISIQPAEVAFRVNSDGTVEASTFGSGIVDSYNWITPTTGSTTYFVRATLNSGSLNSGNTGIWEALTTDRVWTVYKNEFTSGSQIANLTIAISSNSGGTNIVASANISLEATVT
jgi:hypothetical protein